MDVYYLFEDLGCIRSTLPRVLPYDLSTHKVDVRESRVTSHL